MVSGILEDHRRRQLLGRLSIDEKLGIVFVSTGSATFDFFGDDRAGANLFANSILALKAATGERIWHFQTVHHDLWDYDIPCQCEPTLIRATHNGAKMDLVAQVSKTGWVYLFERATGKPLYPIEERPVPQSDLPGERTYPTQPFPTNPPAFSRQGISRDDLTNISPESHAFVLEQLKDFRFGPCLRHRESARPSCSPGTTAACSGAARASIPIQNSSM